MMKLRARRDSAAEPAPSPPHQDGLIPAHIAGPPLSDDGFVKMYSRSKISLGFSSAGDTHAGPGRVTHLRLRDFEAPMSGALYLVEYMPELEQYYEIGKEIVCYTDKEDLLHKLRYYLAHEDEAEQIRRAARRRAVRDHTWKRRFEQFFAATGLSRTLI
jgi:spore maturation protein CgeB